MAGCQVAIILRRKVKFFSILKCCFSIYYELILIYKLNELCIANGKKLKEISTDLLHEMSRIFSGAM